MRPSTDVIVLSSPLERNAIRTPPQEELLQHSLRGTSSSPLPSPSELFRLPSRSRFFATPDRNRSKTKDRTIEESVKEKPTVTDPNAAILENKQKPRCRRPMAGPQAALPDTNQVALGNEGNAPTKPKRTRKKRADGGAANKKPKNKTIIGKAAKAGIAKSKEPDAEPGDQPSSKPPRGRSRAKEETLDCRKNDDSQLEPALKRRLDWTPTKEPAKSVIELEDTDGTEAEPSSLRTLLSGYEYNGLNTASNRLQVLADNGPTKRRRIELVESRFLPLQPKSPNNDAIQNSEENTRLSTTLKVHKKPKTRTKKFTTLTARVTASYFRECTESSNITEECKGSTADPKSRRTKRKADSNSVFKVPRTIVLSPEAAVKSLDEQDLLFGTCSQLERADSPTMLRQTQIALQESEKESSFTCSSRLNHKSELAYPSTTISCLATPRNLWTVAARDSEGLLVDAEVVELIDSPEVPTATAIFSNDGNEREIERGESNGTRKDIDMSQAETLLGGRGAPINGMLFTSAAQTVEPPTGAKPKAASKPPMPLYSGFTDINLVKEFKSYGLKPIKNRKKMIEVLQKCWTAKNGPSNQVSNEDSQRNEATAPVQPSTASEPHKPEKRPKKPRATSQIKTKAQSQQAISKSTRGDPESTATNNESEKPSTKSESYQEHKANNPNQNKCSQPTRRSCIDVEEIQDSEDELIPSPSKLQSLIFSNPQEIKQQLHTCAVPSSPNFSSYRERETATVVSVKNSRNLPDLGENITKAVRAQPRQSPAGGRSRPSWHEKILMYDPIYLEDFTSWLNTEGLGLVDEDRQVGAGLVRQWCESKGICCCYRVKKMAGHF